MTAEMEHEMDMDDHIPHELRALRDKLLYQGVGTISRDKGGQEWMIAPPLIDQLRDAIFLGLEQGNGAAFGAKLPLASNALDLWNEIEAEASALYVGAVSVYNVYGREMGLAGMFWDFPEGDDKPGNPSPLTEDAIRMFSTLTPRPAPLDIAEAVNGWLRVCVNHVQHQVAQRIVARWVHRIEELLKPTPMVDLAGTCPSSGRDHVIERGKRRTALYVMFGVTGEPEVHSRVTGDVWSGVRSLYEIGFHIGATVDPEVLRAMGLSVGIARVE